MGKKAQVNRLPSSWTQEARTAALESKTDPLDNIHTASGQPNPPHHLPSGIRCSSCPPKRTAPREGSSPTPALQLILRQSGNQVVRTRVSTCHGG